MARFENTTMFGGKPYPIWQNEDFQLPGYQNARIVFRNIENGNFETWGFLVSPTAMSVQQGSDISISKTMAGYFIGRGGPSIGTLSISGYFVDTLRAPERLAFLEKYATYCEDNQNRYMEFISKWSQEIIIEGTRYAGLIQSMNMSKSSNQQFLYQYTITFIFYKTSSAYSSSSDSMSAGELKSMMGITTENNATSIPGATITPLSSNIVSILNGNTV